MQNNVLDAYVSKLEHMPMKELKELWYGYYNTCPPHFNKLTLVYKLAYRIQELEYGSLKKEIIDQLIDYSSGGNRKRKCKATRPVVGTRLIREYRNEKHFVTVLVEGYEYEEKVYKSLSAIARKITGTNWNGNLFFGLISRRRV